MSPKLIISTMRTILREQCTSSYMPQDVIEFIENNKLLKLTTWPAWVITLTPKGREFIWSNETAN